MHIYGQADIHVGFFSSLSIELLLIVHIKLVHQAMGGSFYENWNSNNLDDINWVFFVDY